MKIELSKQTLRVLTDNETELVAGAARATNPSRIPCISDSPLCARGAQHDHDLAARARPAD